MAQFICGRNTVLSALKERKVETIFLLSDFHHTPIINELKNATVDIIYKSNLELDEMIHENHQGVVAIIKNYNYYSLEEIIRSASKKQYPLIIILDGIEDPHNLGAILRCADAFGADGVLIKKHGQVQLNATVAKVSTGAIDFVKVAQVTNLVNAMETLKKAGYWIVASDGEAGSDYRSIDYKMATVLIIGSEGDGISRLVLKNSDFQVKICMQGHVNSLNASVATAVLLAQIQNNRFPL